MDGGHLPGSDGGYSIATEDGEFKIKGAASRSNRSGNSTPLEDCIICLQPITERAVAVPCNHLSFDFICLVSWLQQRQTCPLCNAAVTVVQFDWRGPSDFKSFEVQPRTAERRRSEESQPSVNQSGQRYARQRPSNDGPIIRGSHSSDPALERRRIVYQSGLYSLHVGANTFSGFRDFSPREFAASATLQRRARIFLRRELQVFTYLDSQRGVRNRDFILEYIVAMLKKFDPKAADGRAEDLLSEFVHGGNARLLLHELLAWLRSPYATLAEWDENVQYSSSLGEPEVKGAS